MSISIPDAHLNDKDSILVGSDSIPVFIKSESMKIDRLLFITQKQRKEIAKKISQISSIELVKNFSSGTDGTRTKIEIGDMFNFISYDIWGLSMSDKKRNKAFKNAVLSILEAAKIDSKLLYY